MATPTIAAAVAVPRPTRRPPSKSLRGSAINLFYVPALVLFAVFIVYPFVSGISLSATDWDGYSLGWNDVGFANYASLLQDETFRQILVNTIVYGVGSTLFQQVLGLGLALALNRRARGSALARAVIYLPALVSPVIMGTMYYLLFQYDNGALNDVLHLFGFGPVVWMNDSSTAIGIIVAVNTLQFVGISMVIYLAGLAAIPEMYYEASSLDGATSWQQFRMITIPLLQPALAASIVLNLIGGLKLFDVIQVLTGGGPGYSTNSVSTFIGVTYFNNQSAGYAAAMGVFLFVLILASTLVLNALLNRRRIEV